jgi:deazaflavin-dependent oxidoreductase (nitroreductase family)
VTLPPAPALPHPWLRALAARFLNPVVLRLGLAGARWSPIGVVLHVGRRSGRRYATPLAVHRRGDRLFVPLTYGPDARWCLNVLAAGGCRMRLHGRELAAVRPRVIGRAALPASLARLYRPIGMRDFLELAVASPSATDGPTAVGTG